MYEEKVDAPMLTEDFQFESGNQTPILNESEDKKKYKKMEDGSITDTETGQNFKQTTV